MQINNININMYSAKLLSREIKPSERNINNFYSGGTANPYINKNINHGYKQLNIEIELKGTPSQIEVNKSNLLKELNISKVKFEAIDNFYDGFTETVDVASAVNGFEIIKASMLVIEHEEEKTSNMDGVLSTTINLTSNNRTPAIIEIVPSINLIDLSIKGLGEDIKISNLIANRKITIDGEIGKVLEGNINKFIDYDSWGFPYLEPGENNIVLSKDTCKVTIKYKPRWV